jgi:hypothetical protein
MRFNPDFTPDPLFEIKSKFSPRYAKLIDGKVIPCTLMEWVDWFGSIEGRVALDETETHLVSTVFLGLDHRHFGNVRAHWFETMIFDKSTQDESIYCDRYSSLEEAIIGHAMALAWLKGEL